MSRPACRATPWATTAVFRASPASSTPVPRPVQSAASPPNKAQASAAADVVLPIPISPVTRRSAPGSTAAQPTANAATTSASVIAGPAVKSCVGRSSSSACTSMRAPKALASWLIAAPPARKLATIWTVTSAGNADTPRAVTPWLPAKISTSGRSSTGRSVPCHAAIHDGDLFQPPQRSRRFRQDRIPRQGLRVRARIGRRHFTEQAAEIGKALERRRHGLTLVDCLRPLRYLSREAGASTEGAFP